MRRARAGESGFALLVVLAMAAAAAIMMYIELPRVAFEAQRTQEQVLIDRGEQYKRAIQLYMRKFRQYPPSIEALENTNNIRYLRRRYKDPMTGQDDWRIIHGAPNGMLTDSKVQKVPQIGQDPTKKDAKDAKDQNASAQPDAAAAAGAAPGGQPDPAAQVRANLRRRPSEGQTAMFPGAPAPPSDPTAQPYPDPNNPQASGQPPAPGQQAGQQQPGQTPGQPQPPPGFGQPYAIGGGQQPPPSSGVQSPQNPAIPSGGSNDATKMIQNILTSPRPGGLSGLQSSGPTITGGAIGIAGVASKYEGEGIKTYNERSKYQEWEFVYRQQDDPLLKGPAVGGVSGLKTSNPGQTTQQPQQTKPDQ